MRKAIKDFKDGKGADVDFKSDVIPAHEIARIKSGLSACKSTSDIRQVFAEPTDNIMTLALAIREATKALVEA